MNPKRDSTTNIKNPISTLIQPFLNKNTMMIVTTMIWPMIIAALVKEEAIFGLLLLLLLLLLLVVAVELDTVIYPVRTGLE